MNTPKVDSPGFPDPRQERRVMAAWERYLGGSALPPNSLRDVIERSWQRCLSSHVDPGLVQAPTVLPTDELMAQRRRHRELVEASVRIMAEAHEFLSESGTIMILTDPSGVVLQTEGDPGALEAAFEPRLVIGANWSETDCGTNAIGTALSTGRPAQVHAGEHDALLAVLGDQGPVTDMVEQVAHELEVARIVLDDEFEIDAVDLHGLPVFGGREAIPGVARKEKVDEILIAIPSLTEAERIGIEALCEAAGKHYRVMQNLAKTVLG